LSGRGTSHGSSCYRTSPDRGFEFRGLCTAKGMSAEHTGRHSEFAFATTNVEEIWKDPGTEAVFVATRHDLHASLVLAALRTGKHVFVEKPLCIRAEELAEIAALVSALGPSCPLLTVGFNRRFAPATRELRRFFDGIVPLSVSHRFSPGPIPPDHWTQDEDVGGGRIVGEACHAIDTCTAIVGSPPVRVFAESVAKVGGLQTTDDRVFITLRHADGSISTSRTRGRGTARRRPSGSRCSGTAGRAVSRAGTGSTSGPGPAPQGLRRQGQGPSGRVRGVPVGLSQGRCVADSVGADLRGDLGVAHGRAQPA